MNSAGDKRERHPGSLIRPVRLIPSMGLILGLLTFGFTLESAFSNPLTGQKIMDIALSRHDIFPYVYEELSMILTDSAGHRDVRKLRRFSRIEADTTYRYLLVFDHPTEVRGVALWMTRLPPGDVQSGIYLPALGKKIKAQDWQNRGNPFLGTDFTLEDLLEAPSDYVYKRTADEKIDKKPYFTVDAFPKNDEIERQTGYGKRRHFIRQDIFFIVRTDYFDRNSRFFKSLTRHDLKQMDKKMWRANMVLMNNLKGNHRTLIKTEHRIFSHDYVPPEIFTWHWLFENRHLQKTETLVSREALKTSGENGEIKNNMGN